MKSSIIVMITAVMTLTIGLGLLIATVVVLCSTEVQGGALHKLLFFERLVEYSYKKLDFRVLFNNRMHESIEY